MSDPALVHIYLRSEGYYLVTSAMTTTGLWQHVPEPPTFLGADSAPAQIGREVRVRLAKPRPRTIHPKNDEWTEARRKSLAPIIRAAKVRSWRAFISNAATVDVHRADQVFTVTPMKALAKPHGSFEGDVAHETRVASPTMEQLGQAVIQAFAAATPA